MIVKLLTQHHLEFLSLKGGCRGSSESTHVKMPHCWKSHALAQMFSLLFMFVLICTCLCDFFVCMYVATLIVETHWYTDKKTIPLAAYENICRHYIVTLWVIQ